MSGWMKIFRAIITVVLFIGIGLASSPQPTRAADGEQELLPPPIELIRDGNPKLDSRLNQMVAVLPPPAAFGLAQANSVETAVDTVRVIVEALPDQLEIARGIARGLGTVETSYDNLLQVIVPVAALNALADSQGVRLVRTPLEFIPDVVSEGVSVINANQWQSSNLTGAGVKIGIIDSFAGYTDLLGTELPASVNTWWAPSIGGPGDSEHGTACAEIIYDIAPGAQFYLASVNYVPELGNAVDWMIAQGVQVISFSAGWPTGGPGDGTGLIDEIVDTARAAGILWVNAAGNSAQVHWSGDFTNTDGDPFHEFVPGGSETNRISASLGQTIQVYLKWDDPWESSSNDYDLLLYDSTMNLVALSQNIQDGNDKPTESLSYTATYTGYYYIVIGTMGNPAVRKLHLYTYNIDLYYQTAAGSLTVPADSPNALAVGAVRWSTSALEPFSSQGPTTDNRTKPDLVAPDGVSTVAYSPGSFYGTSAAAPHVAGAAALVKQLYPNYTPAQLQDFLEDRAVDLGSAGKDNLYGSGRLFLGNLAPSVTSGDATSITTSLARLNGNLTSLGVASSANVSFQWGTTSGNYTAATPAQSKNSTGDFYYDLGGLSANTTYYFRAKSVGYSTNYGAEKNFTTLTPTSPEVVTNNATSITLYSARLSGNLTALGTASSANVSFQWGSSSGNYTAATPSQSKNSTGDFYYELGGLSANVTYYFRARVVGHGTAYGDEKSFTTQPTVLPTVVTDNATFVQVPSPTLTHFEPSANVTQAVVTRIIDGDTIEVDIAGATYRVRYIGMDTPEMNDTRPAILALAQEAKTFNRQLVEGKSVRLEKDVRETDQFGRLLRYVYVGDLFVNGELVRLGYAQAATYPPDVKYQNLFLELQTAAEVADIGLWATNPSSIYNMMRLNSNLSSLGTASSANVSFQWGTASGNYTAETTAQSMNTTGTFYANLSGLSGNATYYYQAKAVGHGVAYGDEKSFILLPAMQSIAEVQGQYYKDAPVLANLGFTSRALDNGWYQTDNYSGNWTALFGNSSGTAWTSANWTVPGFTGLSEGSHTIYFKASDDVGQVEGESGEWSWQFYKDTTPPSSPASVNSTSHAPDVWSSDNTVAVSWLAATDNLSGLDGYYIVWDTSNSTVVSISSNTTNIGLTANVTSTALNDSNSHYFHIRSVDKVGNLAPSTTHLGPFFIDTGLPSNPTSVNSTSHSLSVWSSDNTVAVSWLAATDNLSGLDGYSIVWDTSPATIPDQTRDIGDSTTNITSSALNDGNSNYFHIRSMDEADNFASSAVHLGPFFIDTTLPTIQSIAESQGGYYNTAPIFASLGFSDSAALDSGWYQMDSYSGNWTVLFTNNSGTAVATGNWVVPAFANLSEGSHTIYFKASDDIGHEEGETGEWGWQFYKDTIAPSAVGHLTAGTATTSSIQLRWTAPGNNADNGTAATYDIRYSTANITSENWGSAAQYTGETVPSAVGSNETFSAAGLSASTTYYFALKTADQANNSSGISNVVKATTLAETTDSGGGSSFGGFGGFGGFSGTTITLPVAGLEGTAPTINTVTGTTLNSAELQTSDGDVTLSIASGTKMVDKAGVALSSISAISVNATAEPPSDSSIVLSYELGPTGAQFNPPLTLTMAVDPKMVPTGVPLSGLYMAYWDGTKWIKVDSIIDPATNTLTAQVSHFTEFAIIAEVEKLPVQPSVIISTPVVTSPPPPPIMEQEPTVMIEVTAAPAVAETTVPATITESPATPETIDLPAPESVTEPTPVPARQTFNWMLPGILTGLVIVAVTAYLVVRTRRHVRPEP